ncbi:MAG: hypothetical protein SV765_02095 [Pseudomonadota bacterium]|nr:hypothetical protein [Pseudomonadota bacterium]
MLRYFLLLISLLLTACSSSSMLRSGTPQLMTGPVSEKFTGTTLLSTDNSVYVGEMRNGKPHGQGTWYLRDKMVLTGNWNNGELQGKGTVISIETNSIASGNFENGRQQGEGYFEQNGRGFYGQIVDDVPEGTGKCVQDNQITACEF